MARPRTPPVPIRMYRHFAVATLVITGLLALTVDWESNQSVTRAMAQPASPQAQKATPARASNFRDARSSRGYRDSGDGGSYEDGGIIPETGDFNGYDREGPALANVAAPPHLSAALPLAPPPGMSPAMFERMKQARPSSATPDRPSDESLRALVAASLQRSGSNATEIE